MEEDQTADTQAGRPIDESYWAALFQQETSFVAGDGDVSGAPEPSSPPKPEPAARDSRPASDDGVASRRDAAPGSADLWEQAQACLDGDLPLQLRVIGHNKGGLLVDWNGLPGFVPASQLIDFPQFHLPRERMVSLAEWYGRELNLKIIEADRTQNRLILSERAALVAAEQKESLLSGVRPGERRAGLVTNLTEFGAFVDLGGVEGLVHKSEISWSRVQHPGDVLQPGQTVEVLVLGVDPEAARIALSIKQLRPDPWLTAEERYRPGQRVSGVVGNIMHYGAFVILEPELEGLVHYTELAEGAFLHPRDVVYPGQAVVARVLSIDSRRKRIALSLRGAGATPDPGT